MQQACKMTGIFAAIDWEFDEISAEVKNYNEYSNIVKQAVNNYEDSITVKVKDLIKTNILVIL